MMRAVLRCSPLVVACLAGGSGSVAHAAEQVVYLLGGQSNMLGRAATSGLPAALKAPQSDISFYFNDPGSTGVNYNNMVSLQPLTTSGTTFGPEITFGRAMKNANPAENITLIKYARGGTTLSSDWKVGTGPDYQTFIATVDAGLAAITARGDTYRVAGMLWLQGESDSGAGAAAYGSNIANFIANIRGRYGANLPFVMGGIGYQTADYSVVSAALQNAANTIPNTAYFSNYDLLGPNHTDLHFDASEQQVIGQRFATAISSIPEPTGASATGLAGAMLMLGRRRRTEVGTVR